MRIAVAVLVVIGIVQLLACGGGGRRVERDDPVDDAPEQERAENEPARPGRGPVKDAAADDAATKAAADEWDRKVAEQQRQAAEEDLRKRIESGEIKESPGDALRRRAEDLQLDELAELAIVDLTPAIIAQYVEDCGRVVLSKGSGRARRLPDLGNREKPLRRWLGTGTVGLLNNAGDPVAVPWELHWAHRDEKFIPVALWVNGDLVFSDRAYASLEARATDERHAEEKQDTKRARLYKSKVAKEAADSKTDEEKAAALLKTAKAMLTGNKKAAQKRLQQIVDDFPDTEAAGEAAKLLEK